MTRGMRGLHRWIAGTMLAAGAAAGSAGAQARTISGVIVDTLHHPVADVTVDGGHGHVVTDDSGHFAIKVGDGKVLLDVRRIGFMPMRYGLLPGGGDTTIEMMLLPMVQRLAQVDVKARSVDLQEFAQRLAASKTGTVQGVFFTADDIDKRNPTRASQLFEGVPGVYVQEFQPNRYVVLGNHMLSVSNPPWVAHCIVTTFIDGSRIGPANVNTLYDRSAGQRDTRADVVFEENGAAVEFDDLVNPSTIAGIEYYEQAHDAPAKFQSNVGECGVLLIWTKRGRDP